MLRCPHLVLAFAFAFSATAQSDKSSEFSLEQNTEDSSSCEISEQRSVDHQHSPSTSSQTSSTPYQTTVGVQPERWEILQKNTSITQDFSTVDKPRDTRKLHLDASFTAGTTGLGFDFAMPINDYVGLRTGATFMPRFNYPLTFTAQIGEGDQMTADGLQTRFERMATLLEGFVGQEVDDKVDMLASPYRVNQFKFMVDVTPFRRKSWHFTTGFYLGQSKIARCINENHEIATLFAVNLYNRLYENNGEIALGFSLPPDILVQILYFGQAGFPLGQYVNDVVYTEDVWEHDDYYDEDYIVHPKGEIIHPKGSTYLLAPNEDNTVFVDAFVNKFRPYFGIGYNGSISRDKRWSLGFDAGIMMWGGAPKLMDHSGVDLMYDLKDIGGQVGDYVKLARHIKAYPVLELKISHRLF